MGQFSTLNDAADQLLGLNEKTFKHYGVRGMRWGVRKRRRGSTPTPVDVRAEPGKRVTATGGSGRPPSDDAKRAAALKQKARASTIDSLSNKEIQTLIARMNLEQSYVKLDPPKEGLAKKFLKQVLKTEVDSLQRGKTGPAINMLQEAFADQNPGKHRKKK